MVVADYKGATYMSNLFWILNHLSTKFDNVRFETYIAVHTVIKQRTHTIIKHTHTHTHTHIHTCKLARASHIKVFAYTSYLINFDSWWVVPDRNSKQKQNEFKSDIIACTLAIMIELCARLTLPEFTWANRKQKASMLFVMKAISATDNRRQTPYPL